MYAVFQIGSKQYRVKKDQIVRLERLNVLKDTKIEFNNIMMIVDGDNIQIGNPFITDWKVIGQVINHDYDKKILIVKFRRRKHYRKSQGHRQCFTNVKIINISA